MYGIETRIRNQRTNIKTVCPQFPYTSNHTSIVVMAKDKGTPPLNSTVRVTVSLAASQGEVPTWDGSYDGTIYEVEETVPSGHTIAQFSANSNIMDPHLQGVSFALIKSDGSQSQFDDMFRISTSSNTVKLKLRGNLDYNIKNMYTVRLRVTVRHLEYIFHTSGVGKINVYLDF